MDAKGYMDAATAAYDRRDLPEALRQAELALAQQPDWPLMGHALHALGTINAEMGNPALAADWYERYLNGDVGSMPMAKTAVAWFNLGRQYRLLERYQMAIDAYQHSVTLFTESRDRRRVGWAYCNLVAPASLSGQLELARQACDQARELAQDDEDCKHVQIAELQIATATA